MVDAGVMGNVSCCYERQVKEEKVMDHISDEVLAQIVSWWLGMFLEIQKICLSFAMHMFWNMKQISPKSYTYDSYAKRARLRALVYASDTTCFNQIRMYRHTFDQLCGMLDIIGGLRPTKNMLLDDQVAIFIHILAHHHVKNRVVQFEFQRLAETVSRHFNSVLNAMMLLVDELFKQPEPVLEDSTDERWKLFKGEITTNVLGVCSHDGQFVYVLSGWEGSAANAWVLKDAIERDDGLKVVRDQYYLVDAGFANCRGFLAPYRGQRYHLNTWRQGRHPTSPEESFNMRHSSARNVIERCFGMLKKRWAILRSPSFYPVPTQNRVIIAYCLLHNLCLKDNALDPVENQQVFEDTPIEDADTIIEPSLGDLHRH
ncbi:protein ALP1-like [Senna tora]|uniref:Protein ALP1-like n=1 Tax=Senna tora TaxID=362788 RepID=A0A834TZZ5_9FABA|nr:protein ALP1-like [Senna tora]